MPAKIAPTFPKFLAEEKERDPRSLKPARSCWRRGSEVMAWALGEEESGVSYCIWGFDQHPFLLLLWMVWKLTDAMNNPKAPPSAKPITPDTTVFPGQDSMSICIYQSMELACFPIISLSFSL